MLKNGKEFLVEKTYPTMNEEEKEMMWNLIADWLSIPEQERLPKTKQELYLALEIPESTFYWQLQQEEFMRRVLKLSLIKAKNSFPRILKVLEKNAEEGKEKSIEMYMKYVGDMTEKIDHTTKGEKIENNTNIQVSGLDVMAETFEKQIKQKYESNTTAEGVSEE